MKLLDSAQFLKDTANHVMSVPANNGMYRHLVFRQPGNSNMWFEITVWAIQKYDADVAA